MNTVGIVCIYYRRHPNKIFLQNFSDIFRWLAFEQVIDRAAVCTVHIKGHKNIRFQDSRKDNSVEEFYI